MAREKLIAFRKKQKLTQEETAELLGISASMYQALEYGYRQPSINTLNKFKAHFPKMNITDIFLD